MILIPSNRLESLDSKAAPCEFLGEHRRSKQWQPVTYLLVEEVGKECRLLEIADAARVVDEDAAALQRRQQQRQDR